MAPSNIDAEARKKALLTPSHAGLSPFPERYWLGRHQIVAFIGRGGMGEIYLALGEDKTAPLCALKVIAPEVEDDPEILAMFFDEASIMARIRHDNVLRVFEFAEAEGHHFMAMEYLTGRPLVRLMIDAYARGPGLDYRTVAAVGMLAARGLHAAHRALDKNGKPLAVVHRDVSPQNLFLLHQGGLKVLDFGVARASERLARTRAGQLKGKVAYMSPEQVRGRTIDGRSDVFALGVCLWEMAAGCRLFRRPSDLDTMNAVIDAALLAPSAVRGKRDDAFDRIVLSALERERDRRYPTAEALSYALERYLGEAPEPVIGEVMRQIYGDDARKEAALIEQLTQGLPTTPESLGMLRNLSGLAPRPGALEPAQITLAAHAVNLDDLDDFGSSSGNHGQYESTERTEAVKIMAQATPFDGDDLRTAVLPPPTLRDAAPRTSSDTPRGRIDEERTRRERPEAALDEETSLPLQVVVSEDPRSSEALTQPGQMPQDEGSYGAEPQVLGAGGQSPFALAPFDPANDDDEDDLAATDSHLRGPLGRAAIEVRHSPRAKGQPKPQPKAIVRGEKLDPLAPELDSELVRNTGSLLRTRRGLPIALGMIAGALAVLAALDLEYFLPAPEPLPVGALMVPEPPKPPVLTPLEQLQRTLTARGFMIEREPNGWRVLERGALQLSAPLDANIQRLAGESFLLTSPRAAPAQVTWFGPGGERGFRVRPLSLNDCPAEVRPPAGPAVFELRYPGGTIAVPAGGGSLRKVRFVRPSWATRLEILDLGLAFGAADPRREAVLCAVGFGEKEVLLERLPPGEYTLVWTGTRGPKKLRILVPSEGADEAVLEGRALAKRGSSARRAARAPN